MSQIFILPPDNADYSVDPKRLKLIDAGDVYAALKDDTHEPGTTMKWYEIRSSIPECCTWLADPFGAAQQRDVKTSGGRFVVPWQNISVTLGNLLLTAPEDIKERWAQLLDYAFFRCVRASAADLSLVIIVVLTWVEVSLPSMNSALTVAAALMQHMLFDVQSAGLRVQRGKFRVYSQEIQRLAQRCVWRVMKSTRPPSVEYLLDVSSACFHVPFLANDLWFLPFDPEWKYLRYNFRDQLLKWFDCRNRHHKQYLISRPEAIVNLFHDALVLADPIQASLQTTVSGLFAIVALLPMSFWFGVGTYEAGRGMPVGDDHPSFLKLWLKVLNRKNSLQRGRPWWKDWEAERRLYRAFRHQIAVDRWILKQWIHHAKGPVRLLVHDVVCHVSSFLYGDHTFPHDFFQKTFSVTRIE